MAQASKASATRGRRTGRPSNLKTFRVDHEISGPQQILSYLSAIPSLRGQHVTGWQQATCWLQLFSKINSMFPFVYLDILLSHSYKKHNSRPFWDLIVFCSVSTHKNIRKHRRALVLVVDIHKSDK
jgi:hypothetical protein